MRYVNLVFWAALVVVFIIKLARSIRIVPTRKAYIVERLGKYSKTLKAGIHILTPFLDAIAFIQDLKEETIEVPPQMCFTFDNVQVEVDGVIYISVVDAERASYGITNYRNGAVQLAQTTVRSVIGTLHLDTTFEERDVINHKILDVLNEVSESWGIKVHRYEVKNIVPPESVRVAMERQMTAEREKRAVIATSEGEMQSLINKSEGIKAEMINRSEGIMQRQINMAEGKSEEILSIAQATAEAIENVGKSISLSGGEEAVNLRLAENYFKNLTAIKGQGTRIILPADLTNPMELLQQAGIANSTTVKKK